LVLTHAKCVCRIVTAACHTPQRRVLDQGQRLELLHKTQLEGIPGERGTGAGVKWE
jgi:hypothetical protein